MTASAVPFGVLCRAAGLPRPVPEYQFARHLGRGWRFDWAWPDRRVALEVDGGVWTRGRHTRGAGYIADMQKLNAAALEGWYVFRVPAGLEATAPTLDMLRRALSNREG